MKPNLFTERRHFTALTLLISLATALSVEAQTVNLRSPRPRVTVPLNSTVSTLISNQVTLNGVTNADFNVSEVSSIPGGGCGATFDLTSRTNSGPVFITLNTTNVSQGVYTFSFNAGGLDTNGVPRTNNLLFILQAGYIWNGTNNAALGGAGNWSDSTKWLGGGAPGVGDDVIFSDLGGQTNSVVSTIATTNPLVNTVVDVDTTIGSLRFSQTNTSTRFHTLRIDPGRKLTITGTNGFALLRDYIAPFAGVNAGMTVTVVGTNATMTVSNKSANFAVLVDGNLAHALDMSRLDHLVVDVNRVGLGDVSLEPNYWNFQANGYNGVPNRFASTVTMARTNFVTASYVNPFSLTNGDDPTYSVCFMNSVVPATTFWNLGVTNVFLADSVCLFGPGSLGTVQFNPAFATNTSCYAYFRNTNGGRMTMFAISDNRGTNAGSQTTRGNVFFGQNGGSVDILADKFIISRDRRLISSDQVYQGWLYMGKGLVDANYAAIGFQDSGGHTNLGIPDSPNPNKPFRGYCQGIMAVSNSAVFKVNGTLDLGYTTETNDFWAGVQIGRNRGAILIGPGGTVMVNTVGVGGVTKFGGDKTIGGSFGEDVGNGFVLTGGASLIVSNKIADTNKMLTTFNLSGNSSLTLHLNGTNTGHYVYATDLTIAVGSTLNIASVSNLPIPPDGTNVPVFFFTSGGANNFAVTMPSPMRGTIVPGATANEANLNIITNQPKNLVWRGPGATATWDKTTKNWLDTATGILTNYINGDAVLFDDLAAAADTVTLSGTLIPDSITVSNGTGNPIFTFNGSGTMPGGSLVKNGSGTLVIGASTAIPVQINQGRLEGTSPGAISSVVVDSGTTMDFGVGTTISPSGVSCAGTATLRGSTVGPLLVKTGGIVTNAATGSTEGVISTESGALLYNAGSLGNSSPGGLGIGSSTIVSNATFINAGNIGSPGVVSTLSVSGLFKDTGAGGLIYLSTLSINGGTGTNNFNAGTFIPGGDGIGTTIIRSPGVGGGNFPGRVQLGTGSTNIFKVNLDTGTNTVLLSGWQDFGPSVGVPTFNGGFLQITKLGSTAYSAGNYFKLFGFQSDGGNIQFGSTNSYPVMSPTNPAPGLAWDLSILKPAGVVTIKSYPTTGTNITFSSFLSSRTNNAGVTNITVVTDMQWPSNYVAWSDIGWHLEQQNGNRTNGLRTDPTNWNTVLGTYFTNRLILTNDVTSNSVSFWRMAYP